MRLKSLRLIVPFRGRIERPCRWTSGAAARNRWLPGNPVGESGDPAPFTWQEARRAHLRAELDAIYAHLYGLTAEELEYVLDTFPIVRRKDEAKWGEYKTKRLVMEAFAQFEY